MFHATEAEGKNPHLWFSPNLDDASVRAFNVTT